MQSESPQIEFDEDLVHWDAIYWAMNRYGFLEGKVAELPRGFVPADLHRPNSEFWITIGNDGRLRLYRRPEDDTPAVLAPETEETRRLQPAPLPAVRER